MWYATGGDEATSLAGSISNKLLDDMPGSSISASWVSNNWM